MFATDGISNSIPVNVSVTVVAPTLVSSISNGQGLYFLKVSSSLRLDGSSTFFDDGSSISEVIPSWECSRSFPTELSTCPELILSVEDSRGWLLSVAVNRSSFSSSSHGSIFALTLTTSSSTQQSTTSTTIRVIQDTDPELQLISSSSKINPTDVLQLWGRVVLVDSSNISWTSQPDFLTFFPPTSRQSPGTHRYNLVIPSGTFSGLLPRYTFTLASGEFSVSVGVEVNKPPVIGQFQVDPLVGDALNTLFELSASYCDDADLPLTYQFGYLDSIGRSLVTRTRSEKSSSQQIYPAGDSKSNHRLFILVMVFDSLSSSSSRLSNMSVVQKNSSVSVSLALSKLEPLSNSNQVDDLRSTLSAIASMVTHKSCDASPHCRDLNREECESVENTCGSCQSSFVGQIGPANTSCFLPEDIVSTSSSCASDENCNPLETCNFLTKRCEPSRQQCQRNCSGHGICTFINLDRGTPESDCRIGDLTCGSVCHCDSGYGGKECELNPTRFEEEKALMDVLMNSLSSLVSQDDGTEENVLSWQSHLSQLTRDTSILSRNSSSLALRLTSEILSAASLSSVSSDQIETTVDSLDAVISQHPELFDSCEDSIEMLASITSSSSLKGREVTSVKSNFRYTSSVQSFTEVEATGSPYLEVTVPLDTDLISSTNSIRVFPNSVSSRRSLLTSEMAPDLTLLLMQFRSGLFPNTNSFKSNPLRLYLTSAAAGGINDLVGNISLTFHNKEVESYPEFDLGLTFNTTCKSDILKQENFSCDVGHGLAPVVLVHDCVGISEVLSSKCPLVRTVPSCQVMMGDAVCSVDSFTSLFTICTCQIPKLPSRRLDTAVKSMSLQVVSSLSFVSDGFVETISQPLDINSAEDIQKVLIVIILYGALWGGGFGLILLSVYRSSRNQKSVKNEINKRSLSGSGGEYLKVVQDRLVKYLNATLPAVYQNKGWISRMMGELKRHHRYFVLFSSDQEDSANIRRRVLTGIQLLTVQAMLMFLLAMACDLQFPTDDGTCEGHLTQSECVSRKSRVDPSRSYCNWHQNEDDDLASHCKYSEPTFDINAVILVSIVVAILTAPINFLVDFLFEDILSAQSIDQTKITLAKLHPHLNLTFSQLNRTAGTFLSRVPRMTSTKQGEGPLPTPLSALNLQTVKIPSETSTAQSLASELASDLVGATQKRLKLMNESRDQHRSQHLVKREKLTLLRKQTVRERERERGSLGMTSPQGSRTAGITVEEELLTLFSSFVVDLSDQRKALKPNQRERLDVRWGVDPTGEFSRHWTPLGPTNNEKILRDEMKFVRTETQKRVKKLEIASDSHVGLELMHLFMLDVLGRETPAAKIFLTKISTGLLSFLRPPGVRQGGGLDCRDSSQFVLCLFLSGSCNATRVLLASPVRHVLSLAVPGGSFLL